MTRLVALLGLLVVACAPQRLPLAWRSCDAGVRCLVGVVGDGGVGGVVFCEATDGGTPRPVCVVP